MNREESLTIAVAYYLRLQYPKVLFIHVANERMTPRKQNKKGQWFSPQGNKFKRMGVTKGCPDLLIFRRNSVFSALAIELKAKGGKPSPEQRSFLESLKNEGWAAEVCYEFDQAKYLIEKYMQIV